MRGMRGRFADAGLIFRCDDCDGVLVLNDRSGAVLEGTTVEQGAWSVTQRKQRCPGCTETARAKGWIRD